MQWAAEFVRFHAAPRDCDPDSVNARPARDISRKACSIPPAASILRALPARFFESPHRYSTHMPSADRAAEPATQAPESQREPAKRRLVRTATDSVYSEALQE